MTFFELYKKNQTRHEQNINIYYNELGLKIIIEISSAICNLWYDTRYQQLLVNISRIAKTT